MIENSFNIRDKQRCRQTISKGEVNFCFITVARLWNCIMHEQKLYKFAYFVPLLKSWQILRKDIEKRFSILSVKWIHFYFTVILNEMSILRTQEPTSSRLLRFGWLTIAFFFQHDKLRRSALESNLNRLIHFSHIFINAWSILSLKLRYISYVPQRRKLKERNNSVFGMAIEIHGRITASGERVFLLKSRNT